MPVPPPRSSRRCSRRRWPSLLVTATLVAVTACSSDGRDMRPPGPRQFPSTTEREIATTSVGTLPGEDPVDDDEPPPSGFVLTAGWPRGGPIPDRHTCFGDDVSPSLRWFGVPDDAAVLAIVVTDPDADGFVHWAVANIDADLNVLVEGEVPDGAVEATNDAGTVGWSGPCPPEGEVHRYVFELRALDQQVEVASGAPPLEMLAAIDRVSFAVVTHEGRFPES